MPRLQPESAQDPSAAGSEHKHPICSPVSCKHTLHQTPDTCICPPESQAWSLGAQELQLQAWGTTPGKLYSVGMDLAAIDARVVVKLPITDAGLEATGLLRQQGVPVTLTGTLATVLRVHASATCMCSGALLLHVAQASTQPTRR